MAVVRDTTTSWNTTDDATWQAWAEAVHDALVGAGLVQTADTGQINFATVTRPAIDTTGGYAVYRFDDAEQGASPIYIKVLYGSGDSQATPRLQYHVGRGSDGAGNLSDLTTFTSSSVDSADTASRLIHASVIDGALMLFASPNGAITGAGMHLYVERVQDSDGEFDGRLSAFGNIVSAAQAARLWDGAWTNVALYYDMAGHNVNPEGVAPVGVLWMDECARPFRSLAFGLAASFVAGDSGTVLWLDGTTPAFIAANSISTVVETTIPASLGTTGISANALLRNE